MGSNADPHEWAAAASVQCDAFDVVRRDDQVLTNARRGAAAEAAVAHVNAMNSERAEARPKLSTPPHAAPSARSSCSPVVHARWRCARPRQNSARFGEAY